MTLPTKIPLRIRVISVSGRRLGEPASFGVPFRRGDLAESGTWRIEDENGSTPVATTVLDRWGDGSVRWMLVDAQLPGDCSPDMALVRADVREDEGPSLAVEATGRSVVVDTGAVRVVAGVDGGFPFGSIEVSAGSTAGAATGFTLTDATGQVSPVAVERVALEYQSRMRAMVLVVGHARLSNRRVDLTARLDLFAGLPFVRLRCTIANHERAEHPGNYWDLGDPGSILIEDASLELRPGRPVTGLSVSAEVGHPAAAVPVPFELYQDSSGGEYWSSTNHINRRREVPVTFRGYRMSSAGTVREGLRATPAVVADAGGEAYGIVVPAFWQNFPRAVEARDDGVTVRFFPQQYADAHELQGGEQKTHECWLAAADDLSDGMPGWCRQPSTVSVDPDWVIASGAVDGLAPLEAGHRALVDQAIDGPDTFAEKREAIDQYGWRHFGDIYGDHEAIGHTGAAPLVSHYNNQYDPVLGFGLQFLRTADPRWRQAMDELAAHVIDIDIYHTDRDKSAYNGGLFWHTYHYGDADTATHRTYPRRNTGTVAGGGPSADHNYPSGLALHYFLTGDVASRNAAIGLAEYVISLEDWRLTPFRFLSRADTGRATFTPPGYHGPARSSGNSLNALVDGHRLTGDQRFLDKARIVVRRAVHPTEDPGRHRLDDPEYRWFYTMFLQALGKYLAHLADRGLIDDEYAYARASLLNYARWMAAHEYPWLEKPEKLEFPTETWAAQDIRKADILTQAARHADGDERDRFLERAAFFHRRSVETLTVSPTRALARPVIVLLTSGHLHAWQTARLDVNLPRPAREPDYGQPAVFLSQRTLAERRATLIAVAGVLVGLLSVGAVALWLL